MINKTGKSVAETVETIIHDAVADSGVELYDIEYVKEGGTRILRLYIDKEGGVGLDDCERVSRAAEEALDKADPIPDSYTLEVSSPGIERKLTRDSHFAKYAGELVSVKLYKPVDGTKRFRGILGEADGGEINITEQNGTARKFDRKDVSSCRLIFFDDE